MTTISSTITIATAAALRAGQTATVTITFPEAMSGLETGDFTVSNGTLSGLATADGGVTWTATFTPAAGVTDTTNAIVLDNTGVVNGGGTAGTGTTTSNNYSIDTTRPTATIDVAPPSLGAGQTASVIITFSEAIQDFVEGDLVVDNGTLENLVSTDGGTTWTATLRPAAGVTDPTNTIRLDNSRVADLAGNAGDALTTASNNYAVDGTPSPVTIALADSTLAIGEATTVTITFPSAATGFTNADLTVQGGTLSSVTSTDNITWTATFTPAANLSDSTNVITLNNAGVVWGGSAGTGTTTSSNYAVDTVRPTATIVVDDAALANGETSTVAITFSEAVSGFTVGDLNVQNGVLTGLASPDGGKTWTATLDPANNLNDASNVITLASGSVTDAAGNTNSGTATSNNYVLDSTSPTATITFADTNLVAGETSLVTFTFSEAVRGFTNADVTARNGTLTGLATTNGGLSWSATFTPAANRLDLTNSLTLNLAGVQDIAGNAGSGSVISPNYAIQTERPTARVSVEPATIKTGQTAVVTITFSEKVTDFTTADITAPNATVSNLVSGDGGTTWSAKLTPVASVQDDTNVVNVDLSGVKNVAGNAGTGTARSNNYAVDTGGLPNGAGKIDGAKANVVKRTDSRTGLEVDIITVSIVTEDRVDEPGSPNSSLADIPLGTKLNVGLPVGIGLDAQGASSPQPKAGALVDLLLRIEDRTDPGSERIELADGAKAFLNRSSAAQVEARSLVLAASDSDSPGPIHITGAKGQTSSVHALVIDASDLPSRSVIKLDNVAFAAVFGATSLRGGDGNNYVIADGAAQNIYLGAGDDELHGGAGDDVVGSAAGNDIVDGGAGNDLVTGGLGNDTVLGGSGDDTLHGDRNDAGQWQFLIGTSGQLSARYGNFVLGAGNWEAVTLADLDQSAPGLGFLKAGSTKLVELGLLYHAAFDRPADLQGLAFWAATNHGPNAMMAEFMKAAEYHTSIYAGLHDAAFIDAVYINVLGRAADSGGFAYWLDKLDQGALSRNDLLAQFALSKEHRTNVTVDGQLIIGEGSVGQTTQWTASGGNDRLEGGAGDDVILGGGGTDTVVYSGALSKYKFVLGRDGRVRVVDTVNGDTDTLGGIERGEFGGAAIDIGFTKGPAATLQSLGMLYQVLFDRTGDLAGLNGWAASANSALKLAEAMMSTNEYKGAYASMGDTGFVDALFQNTGLGSGKAGGKAYWLDYLRTHSRAETVTAWIGHADVVGAQFGSDGLWLF